MLQLIDATTGFHMWAKRYDRNPADVFALQAEIANNIVNALEVTLTRSEQARLARRQTHNREAYEYFLRGKSYRQRLGREANAKARELLEKSIELDPAFSAPRVSLAMTYFVDWAFNWSDDPSNLDRGMELCREAIALDNDSAAAHSMLGWLLMYKRRFDESLTYQSRALSLEPNSSEVHMRLAVLQYLGGGSPAEGISLVKKGMRLDPRYGPAFPIVLGQAYYAAQRYQDAVSALRETIHMNPEMLPAYRWLAATYIEMGEEKKARDAVAEILRISPRATISIYRKRIPFRSQSDSERFLAALRKAGLPES